MITAKRSFDGRTQYYSENVGGIDLLERKSTPDILAPANNGSALSSTDEEKKRMQENMNRLLHYELYAKEKEEVKNVATAEVEAPAETAAPEEVALSETIVAETNEEDITPSSTTMQFGDLDRQDIKNEMKRSERTVSPYKMTLKAKIAVAVYSVLVVLVMALIMVNTGVLASLSKSNAEKAETLSALVSENKTIVAEIEGISGNDYVIEQAIDLGMVR